MDMNKFIEDISIAFAIFCDERNLSNNERLDLADRVYEAIFPEFEIDWLDEEK